MNNIELKVGQVYIEDRGAGNTARRLELFRVGNYQIEFWYRPGSLPGCMSRNRFEGLVRSGVFGLLEVAPAPVEIPPTQFDRHLENLKEHIRILRHDNEKLLASNKRLTDQLRNLAVRNLDLHLPINVR